MKLRTLHKYVSLTFAAVWVLQALTGALLVFHWEFDDALLGGRAIPLNIEKLGGRVDDLIASRRFGTPSGIYWSGGDPARFDVIVSQGSGFDAVRVAGDGTILRERPWNHDYLHIGVFQIVTYVHQTLFAHDAGKWVLGASGLILLSNIIIALNLAWPRRQSWRAVLLPRSSKVLAAKLFAWHRALGLALAAFAVVVVCAGVLMAYEDPLAAWFDDARPDPAATVAAAEPQAAHPVTTAQIMRTALERFPSSAITGIDLPAAETPWFRVELRQPTEWRRVSGRTYVYVSSRSGRVLQEYDPKRLPAKTRFWDLLYAVHTGEAGGWAGRVASMLVGVGLLAMIGLGVTLWCVRRPKRPVLNT